MGSAGLRVVRGPVTGVGFPGGVRPPPPRRYDPENLATLERYVEMQAKENTYDLEANLAVLKL